VPRLAREVRHAPTPSLLAIGLWRKAIVGIRASTPAQGVVRHKWANSLSKIAESEAKREAQAQGADIPTCTNGDA
jgi:hypothetical protein